MKRFVCSDIIPGCSDIFTGENDQSVLDQVIAHAAADHGLVKPPLALVELVVATTHSYTEPKKPRHLRLIDGGGKAGGEATGAGTAAVADDHNSGARTHSIDNSSIANSGSDDSSGDNSGLNAAGDSGTGGSGGGDSGSGGSGTGGSGSGPGARGPRSATDGAPAQAASTSGVVDLPQRGSSGGATARFPVQPPEAAAAHPHYRHECLLYRDTDEFLAGVIPFIQDGLRLGEPVLVAIAEPRQQAVRDALGDDESRVVFADMVELANPARTIPAVRQFVAAHRDGPIRGVGEPIWAGRRAAEITEAQIHESLLDVALAADTPIWVICPYDVGRLDQEIIDEAHRSHSSVIHRQSSRPSDSFGGAAHAAVNFGTPLPEPGFPVVTVRVDNGDNVEIATQVLRFATTRGLSARRSVKLAAVIDEISATGARRTGQDVSIRLWGDESAVVCEVTDRGVIKDPMIGRTALPSPRRHDRDIRLANELCDLVQVRSNDNGTTVRVHSWL